MGLRVANSDKEATKRDIGYVPGAGKDKPQLIARLDTSGKSIGNPVGYVPGAKEIGTMEMAQNFQALGHEKPGATTELNKTLPMPDLKTAVPGFSPA